jgi:hypothetical protein
VSLASNYSLPQSCSAGQVVVADGAGGWACQDGPQGVNLDLAIQGPPQTVSLADGFSIRFSCIIDYTGLFHEALFEAASISGGDVNFAYAKGDTASSTATELQGGLGLTSSFAPVVGILTSDGQGGAERAEGQATLHSGNHVSVFTFHMVVNDASGRCQLNGVATPGH